MPKVLFLPGAGGSPEFWKPVGACLPVAWPKVFLGWPGLGRQPHNAQVNCLDDLVQLVESRIDGPVDLVAQSFGGVVAARIALARPAMVRRLVLTVTSAGVDMKKFAATDWRAGYRRDFPQAADWITQAVPPTDLPVEQIESPTLLIWGDADPISPVSVGQHLEARLPNAKLQVVPGGDHDIALNQSDIVAALIAGYLQPEEM